MVTTTTKPVETTLPQGAIAPQQSQTSQNIVSLMEKLVSTPTMATGTTVLPQPMNVQTPELLATGGVATTTPTATATQSGMPTAITAGTSPTAQQVATTGYGQTAATYTAGQTGQANVPQAIAAQGTVSTPAVAEQISAIDPNATVQGQLANLQADVSAGLQPGGVMPIWARTAADLVESKMAQRGMGQSSMYAEAMAEGIMAGALPIAAADAQTYKDKIFQNLSNRQQAAILNAQNYMQMDMANLSNTQQTSLSNIQLRQQSLLTDQAANNAALQFNATNAQQSEQFFANLKSSIELQNAQRTDAMNQFATAEGNKINAMNVGNEIAVNEANAARQNAINQFNAQLQDSRDKFNVENQRVIDQSNAQWRRTINTANTAAVNAANQTNAANALALSNYAMSALWQEWRDEADWLNTASENATARNHNMALAALERATMFELSDEAAKGDLLKLLGKFGFEFLQ
tara:strand:+ start:53 stop:1441 length:1389 start_codon:yes stop_codon:yes gene_type:complete